MYLYWGYTQGRYWASVDNILKIMNFLKIYILYFLAHIHTKDTNFLFGMPQIYTCTDTQTHAHTSAETPAHTDTDTCTHIHT